jgi:RNA polymerase sigma factor (sigma-70 family)
MVNGSRTAPFLRDLDILNRLGVSSDLTDGELLERFLTGRGPAAEASFAALLDRHGPMVLHVCGQILGDAHQAEDAFQATFLVLVRKAGTVRKRGSVASWLYGVAQRIAKQARTKTIRRLACERKAGKPEVVLEPDLAGANESWARLCEEIGRLPERYREPVVLCYLEGQSTEAAARRLGCRRGTVLSRLARGRARLRGRLLRHSLALPCALIEINLNHNVLPEALRSTSINASLDLLDRPMSLAAGTSSAAMLAQGALHAMTMSKVKIVAVSLLACGLTVGGMKTLARPIQGAGQATPREPVARQAETPGEAQKHSVADLQARLEAVTRLKEALEHHLEAEVSKSRALTDRLFSLEAQIASGRTKGGTAGFESPAQASGPQPAAAAAPMKPVQENGSQRGPRVEPFLRCEGLIFAASPSGNKVIAYNPLTHEEKSVILNAGAENPFEVTFRRFEQGIAVVIQGRRITRTANYDFTKNAWIPLDLSEPASGRLAPNHSPGGGPLAYDVGRHLYTYNSEAASWDHFDLGAISDEAGSRQYVSPNAPARR